MVDQLSSGSGGGGGGGGGGALPAPTGLGTSNAGNTTMTLAWGSVTGAAGYNVFRAGSQVNTTLVSGTSYNDSGLSPGTTYSWTVAAVDANGTQGAMSAPASGTTTGSGATCVTASNYAHTVAGRAHALYGYTYANGSNQAMGLWNLYVTATLKQTSPNYYIVGTCP
jgi:hypothetical protein